MTCEPEEGSTALVDPYRARLLRAGEDLPERIAAAAEPLRGEPAFDPEAIRRAADALPLPPQAAELHPRLERAVRVGLAHVDATFQGDHPKYGVGAYAGEQHDGFPPTIIAAVDALTLWEQGQQAEQLFAYWLSTFVGDDGRIAYYGPSLSEYGQLLTSARRLLERSGRPDWVRRNRKPLARLAGHVRELLRAAGKVRLAAGSPEADTREEVATYFHNNAWLARGLRDWAALLEDPLGEPREAEGVRADARALRKLLLEAVEEAWFAGSPSASEEGAAPEWWLRPTLESESDLGLRPTLESESDLGLRPTLESESDLGLRRPSGGVTGSSFGSYANYRYWPEMLSSGVLPRRLMARLVEARLSGGGQLLGMTRFEGHLDDWPLADYLEGLWALGRRRDYLLSLWGHLCYHQAEGHLTAYEQVSFPLGRPIADYCLPCQLVAPRAARRLARPSPTGRAA